MHYRKGYTMTDEKRLEKRSGGSPDPPLSLAEPPGALTARIVAVDPVEATHLTSGLLRRHGLSSWSVRLDRALARAGACS